MLVRASPFKRGPPLTPPPVSAPAKFALLNILPPRCAGRKHGARGSPHSGDAGRLRGNVRVGRALRRPRPSRHTVSSPGRASPQKGILVAGTIHASTRCCTAHVGARTRQGPETRGLQPAPGSRVPQQQLSSVCGRGVLLNARAPRALAGTSWPLSCLATWTTIVSLCSTASGTSSCSPRYSSSCGRSSELARSRRDATSPAVVFLIMRV